MKYYHFILAILITFFLVGCIPSGEKAPEGQRFQCVYKNVATHAYFYGRDDDRLTALRKAQKACSKGNIQTHCYFRYCKLIKSH